MATTSETAGPPRPAPMKPHLAKLAELLDRKIAGRRPPRRILEIGPDHTFSVSHHLRQRHGARVYAIGSWPITDLPPSARG